MDKIYGVVIIDIVGSRKIKDRGHLQNKLNGYIKKMNKKFVGILPAPIAITLGDEWQIITSVPSECYNFVQEFQELFWRDGVELYAGIGIGHLSTKIDVDIRKIDGPCFHMAREAINIAKENIKAQRKFICI